jgi:hypothetical protein
MAMNGRAIGIALATCAFLAMVFGVTVGAAGRGETSEARAVCLDAVWPRIPAECLIGSAVRDVRLVSTEAGAAGVRQSAELSADVFFPGMIKQLRQDFHFQMQVMNLTDVDYYDGVFSAEEAT